MIKRRVIRSRKENGDITILGNPFEYWNPKVKDEIIEEIVDEFADIALEELMMQEEEEYLELLNL